ncbi:restriction endonuclease subunit S [Tritonibacter scottomollicae]|uniref:restriction endonuclease subunit S n=1 Tax=Tritonibacter scottomollicae TaxID=483013 RepID=UPI003AA7C80D
MTYPLSAIQDLAAERKSALATGPFGSSIGRKTFQDHGVPVIRGSNLSEAVGLRLNDSGLVFIDPSLADKFSRSKAVRGDLVFTCWGTVNQVGLIDECSEYEEYIVSNKQMKLSSDPEKADPLFLYYYFSSPLGQQAIADNTIGSSVPGFNLTALKSIRVPNPPLEVQRGISQLLGSLDDKIELNRRMNETLEEMARALFRDWFVDFGPTRRQAEGAIDPAAIMGHAFPPEKAAPLAPLFPAKLGDDGLPERWRHGTAADHIDFNPKEPLKKGIIAPYSDMASLPTSGSLIAPAVDRDFKSGMRFRNGDALIARITPCLENGKAGFVDYLTDEAPVGWGSTEFFVLRSKPHVAPQFAYCLIRDPDFRKRAELSMTGTSGRQRAQLEMLTSHELAIPAESVHAEFETITTPFFAKIKANGQENQTLAALRDLLLPKLMSGEIRLKDAEASV